MKQRLLIIGTGMAATRLVDEIMLRDSETYEICMVGHEPVLPYNRVLLSPFLAGELEQSELTLKNSSWWTTNKIQMLLGQAVTAIDRQAHCVTLRSGKTLSYDRLVLATGSNAISLQLEGSKLQGIMTFRNLSDVEKIQDSMQPGSTAVVIGGGLLGLEAAYGLAKAKVKTSVIHLMDRLMERQLDSEASTMLHDDISKQEIKFYLSAQTKAFHGHEHVKSVELSDGTIISADLVVMAVGIRPSIKLAQEAGLETGRGLIVNDFMTTSDTDIFALGECVEHRGMTYGLVEPAYEQARILAACLTGGKSAYFGSITATNLKVHGINLFSAGAFEAPEGAEIIILRDRGSRLYRKLVVQKKNGVTRLIGCVLYGNTEDGLWYAELIRQRTPIDHMRSLLAFGRDLACQEAA